MSINPLFILIILAGLILVFGLYVLLYRKERFGKAEIRKIGQKWKELEEISADHPDQAIMKADKLLDHALKGAGYTGSMGDKMSAARHVFRNNTGLWSAHKLRNRIAHDIDTHPTAAQTKSALKSFKKAFHDLGITL